MKPRRISWSRRSKKIGFACGSLVIGTLSITLVVRRIDHARETDTGDPQAGVTSIATETDTPNVCPIRFRDATISLEISMQHGPGQRRRLLHEDTGSGLAWADYDNDGDWDLYVVNFSIREDKGETLDGTNKLFRNDGTHFTEVGKSTGVDDTDGFGMGATFADYDNDGNVDLYVTNYGPNRLFRNRGDGTFEEVAREAGVDDSAWSTGAAWGDYDQDGYVDLYVCNYVEFDAVELAGTFAGRASAFGRHSVPFTLNPNSFDPVPNRLFRNRGDGTFEDVTPATGVADPSGRGFAATFCDLDGDGWLDLYVANDVSENKLFRNTLGDSHMKNPDQAIAVARLGGSAEIQDGMKAAFADVSALTGTADPRGSMGLSVGEFGEMNGRSDGLPDVFVTHWLAQENALYLSEMLAGSLGYQDKTRQFALGEVSLDRVGWGCGMGDFDLDGKMDVVVANGSTLEQRDDPSQLQPQSLLLFWNEGSRFRNVSQSCGTPFTNSYNARGLGLCDFDDDGDSDLAVLVNRNKLMLLRNETSTDHAALKVRLEGPSAKCFGAKVQVVCEGQRQTQWYGADVSFLSMHAPELIFGLGSAGQAEQVVVSWLGGGTAQYNNVAAGVLVVTRPAGCPN